jgi:hypothetical protein
MGKEPPIPAGHPPQPVLCPSAMPPQAFVLCHRPAHKGPVKVAERGVECRLVVLPIVRYPVWSKNPNIALWRELPASPLLSSDLHREHPIPHTQRQLRAEQAEDTSHMDWKTLLAYITGTVDQELLMRNEYLVTENRLLRQQITGRIQLSDGERKTLAEIGKKLGKQALEDVASIASLTRSWPGTANSWPRDSTAPHSARLLAALLFPKI